MPICYIVMDDATHIMVQKKTDPVLSSITAKCQRILKILSPGDSAVKVVISK